MALFDEFGTGAITSVPNAISTGDLISSSPPVQNSPMSRLSCGYDYTGTLYWGRANDFEDEKANCINRNTNILVGVCKGRLQSL
jgi:hypothetical protein